MTQPMHKRPRKARMRIADLAPSLTGASVVLLDRARYYLTGDEVFEALYQHAVDLEALNDAADIKESNEALTDFNKGLREGAEEAIKDLKSKHETRGTVARRLVDINDKLAALADKQSGDLHDALRELSESLDDAIGEIPDTEEQIDALQGVLDDNE